LIRTTRSTLFPYTTLFRSWPEFVFARPWRGIRGLFPRVRPVPFIRDNLLRGVRCIFQNVVLAIGLSQCDGFNLGVDGNHRIAKADRKSTRLNSSHRTISYA